MAAPTPSHTRKATPGPSPDVRQPLKTQLESAQKYGIGPGVYYRACEQRGRYAGDKPA